ncbi:MAG: 2OG-Fe(II) oxygenase, partial [Asticcacaulis sp.]
DKRNLFNDDRVCFFGISTDAADENRPWVKEQIPGIRYFWDFDGLISRAYGALSKQLSCETPPRQDRRFWVILDPTLRVLKVFPMSADGKNLSEIFGYIETLPEPDAFCGFELQPPILYLPNILEPELCKTLIGLYTAHGGTESGFMRDVDGKTLALLDSRHKRRMDYTITEDSLIRTLQQRIRTRVIPEIYKAHQFIATRMERYIVACYSDENHGHFGAHRDNTTKGTAHRKFAISINLNSDFEGGELIFPEYNRRGFKPPVGGAVIFSCSLLHKVSPVTKGQRYAFLPFLYDEAAAKLRLDNNVYLGSTIGDYTG